MSDDAAQDKTTEDDSTAKAGDSADTTAKPETEATAEVKADTPASDAAKPSLDKKSDTPAAAAAPAAKATESKATAAKAAEPKASKPAPTAAGAGMSASLPLIGAFAAGVLLVASIATGTWFFTQNRAHENELAARDDSTATACEFAKAISTYDSKSLDDYFTKINSMSTGDWGKSFGDATDLLRKAMESVGARSTLEEIHCAYESGDENKASVVLVITQQRTSTLVPQPDMLTVAGVAEMEKKDGKWLVSEFDSPALKGLTPAGTAAPSEQPAATTPPAQPGN